MAENVDWVVRQLRTSLRLLAADGAQTLASLPDGCVKPDELALDYDNFVHAYVASVGDGVSEPQRTALLQVDAMLTAMSGADQSHLWTDGAVRDHAKWAEVRAAARKALAALGWESA